MQKRGCLKELIIKAKSSDQESIYLVISRFNPIMRKLERSLGYDEAYSDLTIWMISAIKKYDPIKEKQIS